jgi:hypothetical protein
MMAQSNYPLRLQTSLLKEARRLAAQEGASVNQFINTAVAEKIASLRTLQYLRDRAARGNPAEAIALLNRLGGEPPRPGDEIEGSVAEDAAPYRAASAKARKRSVASLKARAGGRKRS